MGDRPVYVRKEETTRGHVLVVMLAYMIVKRLRSAKKLPNRRKPNLPN